MAAGASGFRFFPSTSTTIAAANGHPSLTGGPLFLRPTSAPAAPASRPPLPLKAAEVKKVTSIVCSDCDGNGAIQCTQCKGTGINSVDHFNGRFKAGATCWLCRGKRDILCGNCNGAGFLGGFLSTQDD